MFIETKFSIGDLVEVEYPRLTGKIKEVKVTYIQREREDGTTYELMIPIYKLDNSSYDFREDTIKLIRMNESTEEQVNKVIIDSLLLNGKEKGNYDDVKRFVDGIKE